MLKEWLKSPRQPSIISAMLSSVDNRVKHRMKSMNEAYFIVYVIVNKS